MAVKKELELYCIGNALVDVFADVKDDAGYGLSKPVQHIKIEKLMEILKKLDGIPTVVTSGGGAANVAKIAAYLGARVSFCGAIAKDPYGQIFEKELSAAGVMLNLKLKPIPTGICLLLKTGSKTRIAASPSAAMELTESEISESDIKRAKIVLIDGFMLQKPCLVRRILTLADKYKTVTAIDLSSEAIAREHAEEIANYVRRYSLILFMNEAEARAFCDTLEVDSPFAIANDSNFPVIVIKLGARGALCFAGGAVYPVETRAVSPLETTGAGDAFSAAFLLAWIKNKPLSECALLGNSAAGIILHTTGTQVDKNALEDLARLLE